MLIRALINWLLQKLILIWHCVSLNSAFKDGCLHIYQKVYVCVYFNFFLEIIDRESSFLEDLPNPESLSEYHSYLIMSSVIKNHLEITFKLSILQLFPRFVLYYNLITIINFFLWYYLKDLCGDRTKKASLCTKNKSRLIKLQVTDYLFGSADGMNSFFDNREYTIGKQRAALALLLSINRWSIHIISFKIKLLMRRWIIEHNFTMDIWDRTFIRKY